MLRKKKTRGIDGQTKIIFGIDEYNKKVDPFQAFLDVA